MIKSIFKTMGNISDFKGESAKDEYWYFLTFAIMKGIKLKILNTSL